MTDQSIDSSSTSAGDETTICYIERVNTERERIIGILSSSKFGVSTNRPVFDKYLLDDVAMSELLQKPENIAEFLKIDGPNAIEALNIELQGLHDQLVRKLQATKEREDELQRIKTRKSTMQEFVQNRTVPQPINKENIDRVQENIRTRLKKEKEQLSIMLAAMFRDDEDTRNMLASLVNKKCKMDEIDGEEYTTFPDQGSVRESIRLLVTTGLFETHADDPLKVRMIDL